MAKKVDIPAPPSIGERQCAFDTLCHWVSRVCTPGSGEDGESQVQAFGDVNYRVEDSLLFKKGQL